MTNIGISCDHAGYELKEFLKERLTSLGHDIKDYGTNTPNPVDYPDFVHPLAKDVNEEKIECGIIIDCSGIGSGMVANRYTGVRAAVCWTEETAKLSRQHINANVISLGGRFLDHDLCLDMVKVFLDTEFEGGRHQPRVKKINQMGG